MAAHLAEHPSNLDRVRIATPCPISWEQMTGDNRVRFCDHCKLNVYDISELSRIEAESLIASTEGRLCARLFRRADGTVLTKDCPVGLRALRHRVAKRGAAIFAAIVSLSASVFGQQSAAKDKKLSCTPQTRVTRTDATSTHATVLSGTVLDPNGGVLPRAEIKLTRAGTEEIQKTSTNDDGRFEFASLAAGNYSITIKMANFKKYQLRNIIVEKDKLIDLDMILEPSGETVTVGLLIGEPSLIDTPPGTTIMNEKLIRSLPIQK